MASVSGDVARNDRDNFRIGSRVGWLPSVTLKWMVAGFGLASRLLVGVTFHNGSGCSRFQFGTATETFFGNVPFHPADFDTLEIEIQKAPAIVRGRFCFAGPVFR
jgi:hypothetical protein